MSFQLFAGLQLVVLAYAFTFEYLRELPVEERPDRVAVMCQTVPTCCSTGAPDRPGWPAQPSWPILPGWPAAPAAHPGGAANTREPAKNRIGVRQMLCNIGDNANHNN